ncbi:MAG: hypothetical protein ACR2NX_04835 [Chthoniobacterales bacterium]
MGDSNTSDGLIRHLAEKLRVVTLGGVAVIAHGLSRNTHDVDVWVEPCDAATTWANRVAPLIFQGTCRPVQMGRWRPFTAAETADVIQRDGVIRVLGLDRPLDLFRDPNELEMTEFDEVWARASPLDDGTRIPDVIDLLVTKQITGRTKDTQDIAFLEAKAESEYLARLPSATPTEVLAMLARFLTPKVAEAAALHPADEVRAQGVAFLRELATEGDPYARDALTNIGL